MDKSLPQYAEVAVGLPISKTFHYFLPPVWREKAAVGKRVQIPFGPRKITGYIVGFVDAPEVRHVKPIESVLDDAPLFSQDLVLLTRWIARRYQTPWGMVIESIVPGPLRRGRATMRSRTEEEEEEIVPSTSLQLTDEQKSALESVLSVLDAPRHQVFLLHGVTGSGKTEIYLQAISHVLSKGKSSIVLVPEISLTPQTIERFRSRFGRDEIAVLHSALLESQRLKEWNRVRSGQAHIVIGARSAVFAPLRSVGLIIVDEEHETSYKQEDAPRYHARDVAIQLGKIVGAPVILGSATPSLETYHEALTGHYQLLTLKKRIQEVPLPLVDIVDMRGEFHSRDGKHLFSTKMEKLIDHTITNKQQAILFLNRRGFSTVIQCRRCGYVVRCKACDVTMTYHIASRRMICHYCHAQEPAPDICPKCQSEYVRFQGSGTQRVESELARIFPQARIARLDTDSTRGRGSHAAILTAFRRHELDVLVGTQMLAKGLDFPQVTLVGIISADTALNVPDFRSAERTFHLLTQVAGRAGRGKLPGRVIVQTFAPHHYAICMAQKHDYASFYRYEIEIRRQLSLPPFTKMAKVTIRSLKDSTAFDYAHQLARRFRLSLEKGKIPVEVLGPSQDPLHRLRRYYRWNIILKTEKWETLEKFLEKNTAHPPRGCLSAVDVDPI